MKYKAVTMADIAQELGISKNAVSLALRGKAGVSEELRTRVNEKAKEMQYSGVSSASGCILALIPQHLASNASMFYHQLCFDMEACASARGYQFIISSISHAEESLLRPPALLSSVPCMGIITVGNLSKDYCKLISQLGLRYVMVDQYYDDVPVSSVTTANSAGAYQLTSHLIERGHRRIQFFGTRFRTSSLEDRYIGYSRAMRDHGLEVLSNPLLDRRDVDVESYDLILQALEEMPVLPTAFVCGHDLTAHHIIRALDRRGLRCPDDFSVVGFDNILNFDIAALNLTTYDTPKTEIAHAAIDLFQHLDSRAPKRLQIMGEAIFRGSVKDIR